MAEQQHQPPSQGTRKKTKNNNNDPYDPNILQTLLQSIKNIETKLSDMDTDLRDARKESVMNTTEIGKTATLLQDIMNGTVQTNTSSSTTSPNVAVTSTTNNAVPTTTPPVTSTTNNAVPTTTPPAPAHYDPNYHSIESQILREPVKKMFPLSLVKDIKLTDFYTLTKNVTLKSDSISNLRSFYQDVTVELNATTGHILCFEPFDLLSTNFTFEDLLPDLNHRLHPMCNRHYNTLTTSLNAFLTRSSTTSDHAPKARASITTDSESTNGFMKLHNILKKIVPCLILSEISNLFGHMHVKTMPSDQCNLLTETATISTAKHYLPSPPILSSTVKNKSHIASASSPPPLESFQSYEYKEYCDKLAMLPSSTFDLDPSIMS